MCGLHVGSKTRFRSRLQEVRADEIWCFAYFFACSKLCTQQTKTLRGLVSPMADVEVRLRLVRAKATKSFPSSSRNIFAFLGKQLMKS